MGCSRPRSAKVLTSALVTLGTTILASRTRTTAAGQQPGPGYRGGVGEPLLLIHGGGGTWQQWRAVIPLLEAQHEVLATNLVGHYGGPPRRQVQRRASTCSSTVSSATWMSLAGRPPTWWAPPWADWSRWCWPNAGGHGPAQRSQPWAAGRRGGDPGLRLVARSYRFFHYITQLMARDPARWSRRPRLRRLLYWHHFAHAERMDPDYAAHMIVGFSNATILPAFIAWAQGHDGPGGLDQIRCPVQLLFPSKDLVFPRRRYGDRLTAAVPAAEVHVLPGVGHVAMWDDPQLVARAIVEFTSRHQSRASDDSV